MNRTPQLSRLNHSLLCIGLNLLALVCAQRSIAQQVAPSSGVLPTDIVPLAGPQERGFMSDNFQIKLLNKLPSRFYLNGSVESSFRLETNPFQYPSQSAIIQQNTHGRPISSLGILQQLQLDNQLSKVNDTQQIYRILPNLSAGWTFTPKTRVYCNYFALNDSALKTPILNTLVQSIGMGVQHDFPITSKLNLQVDLQGRELYQSKQIPVFDYLPSVTLSYAHSARTVAFVSSILQLRGRQPFTAATREIDPFYSFGVTHRRGKWTLSSYATFVQNFRQPFGSNALLPVNNYTWVLDFEAARPLSKRIPSLQAFVRAEPVFNLHSNNTPGLSGFDFRLFYGLRMTFSKLSLLPTNQLVREQLEDITKSKRPFRPNQTNKQAPPQTPSQSSAPQVSPQTPPQSSLPRISPPATSESSLPEITPPQTLLPQASLLLPLHPPLAPSVETSLPTLPQTSQTTSEEPPETISTAQW